MAKRRLSTDVLMSQIGARIRFLRLETGMSLRSLAQKANCSTAALMHIELGRSAISGQPFNLTGNDVKRVVPRHSPESRHDFGCD